MKRLLRCLGAPALVVLAALLAFVPMAMATSPPVAQWHLDRLEPYPKTGGLATPDASGNGLTGVTIGALVVPGRFDSGLALDPGVGEVHVAESAVLATPRLSVLAWVRRDGSSGAYRYVVARGARACTSSSYALYTGADGVWRST